MTLSIDGSAHNNGSGSTLTATITTTGSGLFVVTALTNGGPIISVTSPNLTWTKRAGVTVAGVGAETLEEWTAPSSGALTSETATVTLTSAAFTTMDLFGVKGADTTTKYDSNGSLPAQNGVAGADTLVSTTAADTIIIGAYRFSTATPPTAGSGFTAVSGADFLLTEYKIVSSPQTNLDLTIGTNTGNNNAGVGDAFIPSGGGGGGSSSAHNLMTMGAG